LTLSSSIKNIKCIAHKP